MSETPRKHVESQDENRDPISGEPGSHPIGTGLGAAAGGAVTGAAAGALGGPVGTVLGAAAGAVAGGLAGKEIAEHFDPTAEDAYWREHYTSAPYHDSSLTYDDYRPAYQYGWESRSRYPDSTFDRAENDLKRDWETTKAHTRLGWEKAKHATKDAWNHVEQSIHRHRQAGSSTTSRPR